MSSRPDARDSIQDPREIRWCGLTGCCYFRNGHKRSVCESQYNKNGITQSRILERSNSSLTTIFITPNSQQWTNP